MEGRQMVYPHVTESKRVGMSPARPFPRSQRERVQLSLVLNPTKTVRPIVARDRPYGIFR